MLQKPEILAPAGDAEKLQYALAYGADAVYLAGEQFGLRANSDNFTMEGIAAAVSLAHGAGKRVYVTVNIFAHNDDIEALKPYLRQLAEIGPDALIVSDLGVFFLAREVAPSLPLHISTQANTVNWRAADAYAQLGAARVVLGRELTLAEIATIAQNTAIPLEVFVHGAMCISYSGRCLLSNFLTGRDGNRGACTHPCRWRYRLEEEQRPGEYLEIGEDERGSYIMNSKDLSLIARLPQLIDGGVKAFKIEGRVKSAYYVAAVTKVYRDAVDAIAAGGDLFQQNLPFYQQELTKVSHRHYCEGFLDGSPSAEDHRYDTSSYRRDYDFVAVVKGYDEQRRCLRLEQRNRFAVGDLLEILHPDGTGEVTVSTLYDETFQPIEVAPHPQMTVYLPYDKMLPALSILRRWRGDA